MKRNALSLALTALLALAGVAAHAQHGEASDQFPPDIALTRTRAEVNAELKQFQQSGVNPWAEHYDQRAAFRPTKTRAQVRQEFLSAREQAKAMTGEDSGSAYLASHQPTEPTDAQPRLAGEPTKAE